MCVRKQKKIVYNFRNYSMANALRFKGTLSYVNMKVVLRRRAIKPYSCCKNTFSVIHFKLRKWQQQYKEFLWSQTKNKTKRKINNIDINLIHKLCTYSSKYAINNDNWNNNTKLSVPGKTIFPETFDILVCAIFCFESTNLVLHIILHTGSVSSTTQV